MGIEETQHDAPNSAELYDRLPPSVREQFNADGDLLNEHDRRLRQLHGCSWS
jgi:hypothetical protein